MHSSRDKNPNSERLPKAGDRVGKYVIERVLKRGGMGVVLAARHEDLAQPVAIKVLLPNLAEDGAMVARFLREGRAVSALRSDHVVRVHDTGRLEGGTPYLVMEMLHGQDLDRRVRKEGPLSWQEAVGYTMQVCEALVEAHAIGIVHRDLKPSNLFVVQLPSGVFTVKVLDFGISKADGLDVPLNEQHAITTTEAVLGSPTFMAPEQLKSAKYVDARADIWSLGLVLYFLITGKLAFDAETLGSYLLKILQEPPTPLRSLRPDVPPELEAIVLKCIEKDPALRYPTAVDLRAALAPFAPFAAHVSGMYAAARLSGNFPAAVAPPIFTGLSPSAPTPVGGLLGASAPNPSAFTPATPYAMPDMRMPLSSSSPVSGMPMSSHGSSPGVPFAPPSSPGMQFAPPSSPGMQFAPPSSPGMQFASSSSSEMPSAPPGLASPSTEASWTSAGRRLRPSGLRWAVVAAALAVAGLITAFLWPAPQPPPARPVVPASTSADSAPAVTAPVASATASSTASEASTGTAAPLASAQPSATAKASAAPPVKGPLPSTPSSARTPKTPVTAPTRHISGPTEKEL